MYDTRSCVGVRSGNLLREEGSPAKTGRATIPDKRQAQINLVANYVNKRFA